MLMNNKLVVGAAALTTWGLTSGSDALAACMGEPGSSVSRVLGAAGWLGIEAGDLYAPIATDDWYGFHSMNPPRLAVDIKPTSPGPAPFYIEACRRSYDGTTAICAKGANGSVSGYMAVDVPVTGLYDVTNNPGDYYQVHLTSSVLTRADVLGLRTTMLACC
jgi:hypothetical protein